MKIGVIVLARFSSSRLPGKALKELCGKPVLTWIIERCRQILPANCVILATSDEPSDNPIAEYATSHNVPCFRGSLNNVAERFYYAAEHFELDYAIRINGDNIFLDIDLLNEIISISNKKTFDFISNVHKRTFPKGMSVESIRVSYYKSLLPTINLSSYYQEHVTILLYEMADKEIFNNFYFVYNTTFPKAAGIQLALDTLTDFQLAEQAFKFLGVEHTKLNLETTLQLLKKIQHEA